MKNREGESVKTGARDRMNKDGIDFDGAKWKREKKNPGKGRLNCCEIE